MSLDQPLLAPQERVLSTLEKDGSRRWMYPRLAIGRFLNRRRLVGYLLLAIFVFTPFLRIGGKPVMLLDLASRKFTILGVTFLPTDTVLLALLLVGTILSIFFVTALLGRLWCGWACPQTVYMELVFRPIERLLTGRTGYGGKPTGPIPAWRRALMYAVFFVICLHLANTFLAYFIPPALLHTWITSSPLNHPVGFAIVAVVTGLMLFDFCVFREQTCIIACPYGRLQSVLLDRWSMIISYDPKRGEPRGKKGGKPRTTSLPVIPDAANKTAAAPDAAAPVENGDCVDCDMCVQVCPTGIDIRDGLQVECIGCAQCIDACDNVMDKLKRPRGLVRYSSQSIMAGETRRILRPRVIIYSVIIVGVLSLLGYLLLTRAATDVTVLRNVGRPFVVSPDGTVENILRLKLTNRTDRAQTYRVEILNQPEVKVDVMHEAIRAEAGQPIFEPLRVFAPAKLLALNKGHLDVMLRVTANDGATSDRHFRLLGPMVWPATQETTGDSK